MRSLSIGLLLVALVAASLPLASPQAQAQPFTEHFHTSTYMDAAHTTAHWDTTSGLLKLPPTEPITAYLVGKHDWWLNCPWPNPWASCEIPAAPAVYVPDTGTAFHLADHIAEYDPQRNLAVPIAFSGPAPRYSRAAAAYAPAAGKVYIFGGYDRNDLGLPVKQIYEFDPIARTNRLLTVELPRRLARASAAYVPTSNSIYIFGGTTPDGFVDQILEFDVDSHSLQVLSVGLPTARRDASAVYVPDAGRIYIFGGYNIDHVVVDEILAFDPSTRQLSLLDTRLPVGLHKSAIAYLPGAQRVFIFGGERQGSTPSRLVLAFDPATQSIEETPYTLPRPIGDAAAIYSPESDWLALLGGRVLRLRWNGSTFTEWNTHLPEQTHTTSAVYVPEENKAYLFGSGRTEIRQFDINTSIVYTMTATLPVASTDPGVVWVPAQQLAYVFDRSGIYTYNTISDTLTTKAAELPAGFDPRVVAYAPSRNAIYLFDSADGSGAILRYNLGDGTLVTLGAHLLPPRRGAYAVYVPDSNLIFLFGGWGYQSNNYLDGIMVFDVASETLSPQQGVVLPLPGEYKASVHMPTTNNIFLFGGWGGWSEMYDFPFEHIRHFDTTPIRHMVTHDLTLPGALGYQAAVWASAEDRFYIFGGQRKLGALDTEDNDWIYRLDCAHVEDAIAQSTQINGDGQAVVRATLSVTQELDSGTVDYFLSNDGATTWEAVTPGVEHVFTSEGSDLRWKAVLHGDGIHTPAIDQLTINWLGEAINHPPTNGTVSPSSGSAPAGQIRYFTTTCFDEDGHQDLKACTFHIGPNKSMANNAMLLYNAQTNRIRIRNNTGTKWWGDKLVGSATVVQNKQAKVHCALTTVSRSGNMLQVTWAIEFKPAFRGSKNLYLRAKDLAGAKTRLQKKGTWTIE